MMRLMREIKKIASERKDFIHELYGGNLESIVKGLEKKAKEKGKEGKDITDYVRAEIKKMEGKAKKKYSKNKPKYNSKKPGQSKKKTVKKKASKGKK